MSTFGTIFKVSTFGESHGGAVGCIVDGVPPNLKITEADIQPQLTRRRPGQSSLTTARNEPDQVTILSGTERGVTLGTPIAMTVKNQDQRKFDYATTDAAPRPGHADYTYQVKYGVRASSGGGRASARETIGRVAAGALAEKWLSEEYGVRIACWVSSVMDIDMPADVARKLEQNCPTREEIDTVGTLLDEADAFVDGSGNRYSKVDGAPLGGAAAAGDVKANGDAPKLHTRCPHPVTAAKMCARIQQLRREEDSGGGCVTCVITGVPVGLGEPCFDKLEAELAKAMMSLPATKGFEIGEGFNAARFRGSDHNDKFSGDSQRVQMAKVPGAGSNKGEGDELERPSKLLKLATNYAGGTLGGISSGEDIVFRVAIKPASSISQPQKTCTFDGADHELTVKGRHDPCVLPRAPPLIEGMAALVIADAVMRQRARLGPVLLQRLPDHTPTASSA